VSFYPSDAVWCVREHTKDRWSGLQTPALNDAQQDHDDCDDQENVDEATHRRRSDEPEQPKNNEDYD
jgi:hypothetical protein